MGYSEGTVTKTSYIPSTTIGGKYFRDLVEVKLQSGKVTTEGDSGGVAYNSSGGYTLFPVGIILGKAKDNPSYCYLSKATNIITELGVGRY